MNLRLKRRAFGGYTAMEVVMAAGLFSVGATGVLAMQRSAISGNMRAHKIDVATSVASAWLDRFRAQAALWTTPDASATTGYLSRDFLKTVPAAGTVLAWTLPARSATAGLNPNFDLFGRELTTASTQPTEFCVQYRLTWVVVNRMMRADVRVYWASGTQHADNPIVDATGVCMPYTSETDYSSILSSSVIRGNF